MSPACHRHFLLLRDGRHIESVVVDESATWAARLVFEAIMSAPDLPAERNSGRDL